MAGEARPVTLWGMLVALLLGAGFMATRGSGDKPATPVTVAPAAAGDAVEASVPLVRTTLKPYLEFMRDPAGHDKTAFKAMARDPGLDLLLATVPDPAYADLQADYDQEVMAIQHAFRNLEAEAEGWALAGAWLPEPPGARKPESREASLPWSLLFVRPLRPPVKAPRPKDAAFPGWNPWKDEYEKRLVLLLPESPVRGLEPVPLHIAFEILSGVARARPNRSSDRRALTWTTLQGVAESLGDYKFFLEGKIESKSAASLEGRACRMEYLAAANLIKALAGFKGWLMQHGDPLEVHDRLAGVFWDLQDPREGPCELVALKEGLHALKDLAGQPGLGPTARKRVGTLFRETFDGVARLLRTQASLVRILGPRYSGSAHELALAVHQARMDGAGCLLVSTGSTVRTLRESNINPGGQRSSAWANFWPLEMAFYAIPANDEVQSRCFWNWTQAHQGVGAQAWAEFLEGDTYFGNAQYAGIHPGNLEPEFVRDAPIRFLSPAHLTILRQARAKRVASDHRPAMPDTWSGLLGPLQNLDYHEEAGEGAAGIRMLDPNSAVELDLALGNQFNEVRRRGLAGVRIRMSSLASTLFLARQAKRLLPNTAVAVDQASPLFLHPQVTSDLEGLFCLGSLPPEPAFLRVDHGEGRKVRPPGVSERGQTDERAALTLDALWMLEHFVPQNLAPPDAPVDRVWLVAAPEMQTRSLRWEAEGGNLRLRRQVWISQVLAGRLEPVHVALEPKVVLGFAEQPILARVPRWSVPPVADRPVLKATAMTVRDGSIQRLVQPWLLAGCMILALGWRTTLRLARPWEGRVVTEGPKGPILKVAMETRYSRCGYLATLAVLFSLAFQFTLPMAAEVMVVVCAGRQAPGSFHGPDLIRIGLLALVWLTAAGTTGWVTCQFVARGRFPKPSEEGPHRAWLAILVWLTALALGVGLACLGLQEARDLSQEAAGVWFFRMLRMHNPLLGAGLPTFLVLTLLASLCCRCLEFLDYEASRTLSHPFHNLDPAVFPVLSPANTWFKGFLDDIGMACTKEFPLRVFVRGLAALAAAMVLLFLLRVDRFTLPEGLSFPGAGKVILLALVSGAVFVGWAVSRVGRLWWRLATATVLLRDAPWAAHFATVGEVYDWQPVRGFRGVGDGQPFQCFEAIKKRLDTLRKDAVLGSGLDALREELAKALAGSRPLLTDRNQIWKENKDHRSGEFEETRNMDRVTLNILTTAWRLGPDRPGTRALFALSSYVFLRRVFVQIKHTALVGLAATFLLVLAASTAIQGKSIAGLFFIALLVEGVLFACLLVWFDRNYIFSKVAGSIPGRVDFNREFFLALGKPVLILILGYLLTRFPAAAGALQALLN